MTTRRWRVALLLLFLLWGTVPVTAQSFIMRQFATGSVLPALPCRQADGFVRTGGSPGVFVCESGAWVQVGTMAGGAPAWGDITGTLADQTDLQSALDAKQATLVSGTNIKTINGSSVLGAGDLVVGGAAAWGAITGTLSDQTDLQAALDAKADGTGTADGTNTGDQTSIVGITGSLAEFNAALTGADFATGGGTATGTNTGDQTSVSGNAGTATALQTPRTINGVSFDGTANITVTASADTLTGTTLPALSGVNLTALNATQLTSGTVPDARFPATLPAISGANLTALNATQLTSGTVPDARFPATLPAVSGANLTNLNATNLASGTVATARLGSGTANSTTFLRGDSTWAVPSAAVAITAVEIDFDTCGLGVDAFELCEQTVVDAGVAGTSKIILTQSGAAATGREADENEMDQLICYADPASGSFTLKCTSQQGPTHGKFTIFYTVG